MSNYKVLVTDYEYKSLAEEKAVFAKAGIELLTAQCKTEDDVIAAAQDVDGILNQYAPITRRVMESLPKLQVVSRYGIGVDTVDVQAATELGIIVTNVTDYCLEEVADHALALLLSYTRKVVRLNEDVKHKNWDFNVGVPIYRLSERTLGLVGLGNIPQLVAKRAQAFGIQVLAFDPYISEEIASSLNIELVGLNELCKRSDYVSVHAPLNDATRGLIGSEQFERMKQDAIIVNTARGPVIDEAALIQALQTGAIAGAALDVTALEPINMDNPLLEMDNVIITPHVAWYSEESGAELQRKAAENVASVLSGVYPTYLVNQDVKPKMALKK